MQECRPLSSWPALCSLFEVPNLANPLTRNKYSLHRIRMRERNLGKEEASSRLLLMKTQLLNIFKGYFQVLKNCLHKSLWLWRFKSMEKNIAYAVSECQSPEVVDFAGDMLINYCEFSMLEYNVTPCSQEIFFFWLWLCFSCCTTLFLARGSCELTEWISCQKTWSGNQNVYFLISQVFL